MHGFRWLVLPVVVAGLAAGCSGDESRSRSGARESTSSTAVPSETGERAIARVKREKLAAFLDKAEPVNGGVIGAKFSLQRVAYTSRTDAAAEFWHCSKGLDCTTVLATTDDNWAHTAGLAFTYDLADLLSYIPLGRGAIAIKAKDQSPRRSYPPFILYPDGRVTPLHVAVEPRDLATDDELLSDNYAFAEEIGLDAWLLGADVDAGEIFGLPPLPPRVNGLTYEHVRGRQGALVVESSRVVYDGPE